MKSASIRDLFIDEADAGTIIMETDIDLNESNTPII